MVAQERDGLKEAFDAEDDKDVAARILAVHYVRDLGIATELAAEMVFSSASSVYNWLSWHGEGGPDALRDLPRSGRPRLVEQDLLGRIIGAVSRPYVKAVVVRERIREATGVLYHPSTVRLRMREHGLSHKRAHPVHVNRASDRSVRGWQADTGKRIRDLEREGFTAVAQDEAIILHEAGGGPWLWSRRGERAPVPHAGSHKRPVLYGAVASDGRRLCQVRKGLDAATFVAHLKKLHKKFGKIAVVVDRAPQHRAAVVSDWLRSRGGEVELVYLPVGTPELNVVEGLWHQLRRILAGVALPGLDEFRRMVSGILRTMPHTLDMFAHLEREVKRDLAAPRRQAGRPGGGAARRAGTAGAAPPA